MTSNLNKVARAVTACVATALYVAVALAAQADDPHPDSEAHDQTASETIDVAIVAQDKGWALDATQRHMDDQRKFGDLQDQIEAQFPTKFSGAEFAKTPGGKSYLRFKGAVPTAAKSLAAESGLNVKLTGGRKYSAADLAHRAVAIVTFFGNNGYQQVGAAVLADGTLSVAVTGTSQPGLALPSHLKNGVLVTFADHDVAPDFHTYGGAYIHGSSSQCTTGFSVELQTTGDLGVTTAAHCSGMNHYHQPEGGPAYDTFWEDQHLGLYGDVEWHTTPDHSVLAEYYADPTDRREVNSVETSTAVNNTYCLYSRMQGTRTCDQVYSTYVVMLTSSGLASDLVAMDDSNSIGGDSGGPWSYSTEAAGIVKGSLWLPFKNHDTWSKAWRFDEAIDVEVLTQ